MKYAQPYGVLDPNAPYINGDPSIGRAGSIPPAAAFEEPMREIVQCITGCGLTPTDSDLTQLWQALQIGPWINEYAVDTGSANVYSAAITPIPTQYYIGMRVAVKIGNANTGPCTLNINSLGAHAIKRATGADTNSGDLKAGQVAYFIFDGAYWQIINFLGFTSDTTINNFTTQIPFAVDTGAVNAIVAVFTPSVTVLSAGNPFLIKVMNVNTGPVTVKPNALAAVQLIWPDGSQLAAGDITTGGIAFCVYDGSKLQLLDRINAGAAAVTAPQTFAGVPGTIDLWPTETPPVGAYECNGQWLSRVNDSRLFGIIGTRYGSGDPNYFSVPDLRGEFIRGWSHGSGVDPDANTRTNRGDGTAGDHVGTRQADALITHDHTLSVYTDTSVYNGRYGYCGPVGIGEPAVGSGAFQGNPYPPGFSTLGVQYVNQGGPYGEFWSVPVNIVASTVATSGSASETRPKNVAMMYIIWR